MSDFRKIGSIKVSETTEFIFFLDIFGNIQYGNIRKFVDSKKFSGFTKHGIKFKREVLPELIEKLRNVVMENSLEFAEIVTISEKKHYQLSIWNPNKNVDYINIREWISTEKYRGRTKKGVCIPISHAEELISNLNQMLNKWDDFSDDDGSGTEPTVPPSPRAPTEGIDGVPNEYKEFF